MKCIAKSTVVTTLLIALVYANATSQSNVPEFSESQLMAKDSTALDTFYLQDSVPGDSSRQAKMAIQAELAREVAALSRTNLGAERFTWTHVYQFELFRAGKLQKQMFWNNPKKETNPHLWQVVSQSSDDVFFLDPESGRAATLDLNSLEGNFIPANIAAKAGMTGNQSQILSKKSGDWMLTETTDSTEVWTTFDESSRLELTLRAKKDSDQARAIFEWMKLQPLESIDLPYIAKKYPIQSLERFDKNGSAFRFELTGWSELNEPLQVDASELSIKDPERDLRTIAKEWADEQKSKSGQE